MLGNFVGFTDSTVNAELAFPLITKNLNWVWYTSSSDPTHVWAYCLGVPQNNPTFDISRTKWLWANGYRFLSMKVTIEYNHDSYSYVGMKFSSRGFKTNKNDSYVSTYNTNNSSGAFKVNKNGSPISFSRTEWLFETDGTYNYWLCGGFLEFRFQYYDAGARIMSITANVIK